MYVLNGIIDEKFVEIILNQCQHYWKFQAEKNLIF